MTIARSIVKVNSVENRKKEKLMSLLDTITTPEDGPIVATFTGDSGMGKTSLAATFPNPIVVRAEDGLQAIPMATRPDAFPLITKPDDLWGQIKTLLVEDHSYKTLIIDSVTALDRMFMQHIVDTDPNKPKSINQALGGYGAGLAAVGSMHQRLRKACGMLRDRKGMNIVFIAHADTETIELPDQDPHTRYNLRLGKKSVPPYVDDSDLVGFIKLETFLKGEKDQRKKAISDGTRILVTYATAANVSKNRYGITDDIIVELGVNPLIDYVPSLQAQTKPAKATAKPTSKG